jgi:hypothetical protein
MRVPGSRRFLFEVCLVEIWQVVLTDSRETLGSQWPAANGQYQSLPRIYLSSFVQWRFHAPKSMFRVQVTRVKNVGWNGIAHRAGLSSVGVID